MRHPKPASEVLRDEHDADEDLETLALNVEMRVLGWLRRRGLLSEREGEPTDDSGSRSALDACLDGSLGIADLVALPSRDVGDELAPPTLTKSARRSGRSRGFDIHAGVAGLDAFKGLATVTFRDNPVLADLDALENLTELGWVIIAGNPALTDLPFSRVTLVDWTFDVSDNDALTTLHGFDAVTSVVSTFTVQGNARLPSCEVERLVARIGADNIGDVIAVLDNDDAGPCSAS